MALAPALWAMSVVTPAVGASNDVPFLSWPDAQVTWADTEARQLQGKKNKKNTCDWLSMELLPTQEFSDYQNCRIDAQKKVDQTIAGSEYHHAMQCWCNHNASSSVKDANCCSHSRYYWPCQVNCSTGACDTPAAKKCVQECPALCLEDHYAPVGCDDGCSGCYPYILCITEAAMKKAVTDPSSKVCNVPAFEQSNELKNYMKCFDKHPFRTNWNKYNAITHCACEHKVADVAKTHYCCETTFAKYWCQTAQHCKADQECKTPEAVKCAATCQKLCTAITANMNRFTPECFDKCITQPGGDCSNYMSCLPLSQPAWTYQCLDGSEPKENGCCEAYLISGRKVDACPLTCENGRQHLTASGVQCECFNCPNLTKAGEMLDEVIADGPRPPGVSENVYANGQIVLSHVLQSGGLAEPPVELQAMIMARNSEIRDIKKITTSKGPSVLEPKIKAAHSKWLKRLMECVKIAPANMKDSKKCRYPESDGYLPYLKVTPPATTGEKAKNPDESSNTMLIALVAVGAAVVVGGGGVAAYVLLKKKPPAPQGGTSSGYQPRDADDNVVMGRPVENPAAASTPPQVAAAEGAPVAAVAPKSDDPTAAAKETPL